MNKQEAQMFAFFMPLALLKKAQKEIKKGNNNKVKKICLCGQIYTILCLIK